MRGLTDVIGNTGGVGLFGAIEVAHHNGPVVQDRSYSVTARVDFLRGWDTAPAVHCLLIGLEAAPIARPYFPLDQ